MTSERTGWPSLNGGRYELREPIAIRDTTTLYKAWDTRVERVVAIKMLRSLAQTDRRAIERFRREVNAIARLSHPNAVTLYDFLEEHGEYYLIMEFVSGVNLKRYLHQKGVLSPQEAVQITSQICSVLQQAHANNFLICDMRPRNIMITPDGQVKLTDFGIVYVMEAAGLTKTSVLPDTGEYFSPEHALGNHLTPASDLYSLGVVLYEMLAGRPPFVGSTVQVALEHAKKIPQPPSIYNPHIPKGLELVVRKALQKEPERRYTSAVAMRKDLLESIQRSIKAGVYPIPSASLTPSTKW